MKNFVLGSDGLVGSAFVRELQRRGEEVITFSRKKANTDEYYLHLPYLDGFERMIVRHKPDRVFMCAYAASVDGAEKNPHDYWVQNVLGHMYLIELFEKHKVRMVFPSSSYVFDGRISKWDEYNELEIPNPINIYGDHKLQIESRLREKASSHLIFRTVGIFGHENNNGILFDGKNFVDQVIRSLTKGEKFYAPVDQYMNPIFVDELVSAVLDHESYLDGYVDTVHIAGDAIMSKHLWAVDVANRVGLDKSLIIPVSSTELNQPAMRPHSASLGNSYLDDCIGRKPKYGLEDYIRIL